MFPGLGGTAASRSTFWVAGAGDPDDARRILSTSQDQRAADKGLRAKVFAFDFVELLISFLDLGYLLRVAGHLPGLVHGRHPG